MQKYMKKKRRILLGIAAALIMLLAYPFSVMADVDYSITYGVDTNAAEGWPQAEDIAGQVGCVIDVDTGAVLFGKGCTASRYPASITKIMTALLTLQNCDLNAQVAMDETAVAEAYSGSSNIIPQVGEVFTVEQMLQMLLIKSANDVATALAVYQAGSVDAFAELMNQKALELGCTSTHFANANGLENDAHYTSAYDMCLITKAALQYDKFREIISMQDVTIPATNLSAARYYETHVENIKTGSAYYNPDVIGGKTGYTDISQSTLVLCAQRDGRTLVGCIMGDDGAQICADMNAILNYGFDNFENIDVTYGCETISGQYATVPKGLKTADLDVAGSADTDGNIVVNYMYKGAQLGTIVMSEDNYAKLSDLREEEKEAADKEREEENKKITTGSTKSDDEEVDVDTSAKSEDEDEETKTSTSSVPTEILHYVIYGMLGFIALLIILIIVGIARNSKRRKEYEKRRKEE